MPQEHIYRVSTYTMRRGGVKRLASKVTRDDGAVARLTEYLPSEEAIARARKLFDTHPSFNGCRPHELVSRISNGESREAIQRATYDLIVALKDALPAEHELYEAVAAAVSKKHCFR